MPVGGVAEEKDIAGLHPRRYHPFERPPADQVHCRGEIRHAKHGAHAIKDVRIIADGGLVRREGQMKDPLFGLWPPVVRPHRDQDAAAPQSLAHVGVDHPADQDLGITSPGGEVGAHVD
jgi:hypothetical protein